PVRRDRRPDRGDPGHAAAPGQGRRAGQAGPRADLGVRRRRPGGRDDPRGTGRRERGPMSDTYLNLVNSGVTKQLATKLGLPRPAPLRRTRTGRVDQPLVPGPVLLLGRGAAADALA